MIIKVNAWKCEFTDCGHVWLAEIQPNRCAKCKRWNWHNREKIIEEVKNVLMAASLHSDIAKAFEDNISKKCPHGGNVKTCMTCKKINRIIG